MFVHLSMRTNYLLLLCFLCFGSLTGQETRFTLYYEHDKYELTPEHMRFIDSLNGISEKELYDVHIKGYTNSIGSEAYNLELSRRRAENVKAKLRSFTIISTTGLGEINSEAADNRRVDILIHLKTDHVAVPGEIVEEPMEHLENTSPVMENITPNVGDKIVLEGILFYPDRDVIMDESKDALDDLLLFLRRNPGVRFRLIGHICCGSSDYPGRDLRNHRTGKYDLSEARARSLHNYLAKKGVDTRRMQYIGMAYRQPTGKGDEFDRRVEIEIISID